MATFTIPGNRIRFADDSDRVLLAAPVDLIIDAPLDGSFRYEVISSDGEGSFVDIQSSDITDARFSDGVALIDNDNFNEEEVVVIGAGGAVSTVLGFYDEVRDFDYLFTIEGDPLPIFANAAEAQAFVDTVDSLGDAPRSADRITLSEVPDVEIDRDGGAADPGPTPPASVEADTPPPGDLQDATDLGDDGDNLIFATFGGGGVDAGGGDDDVFGGDGNDDVDLGAGNDSLVAGAGDDTARGGDGDDTVKSGDGADLIDGGDGADVILSGNDDDVIYGGGGNDNIKPGRGNDQIVGGDGDDVVAGFRGDELFIGEAGNDRLLGSVDDDTLIGGAGDDRLWGGPGFDVFVFEDLDFGTDTLPLDVRVGSDRLDFSSVPGLTQADFSIRQVGSNVVLEVGNGTLIMNGSRFGGLDADDVIERFDDFVLLA